MGMAFKENCPDLRNSKAIDVLNGLRDFHAEVDIWDPWIDASECRDEFGVDCLREVPASGIYDGIIIAVAHREFAEMGTEGIRTFARDGAILYDVKGIFPKHETDGRL